MPNKLKSRKFWMAIAGIITNIAFCLGYDLDPSTTAFIASALFALYVIVEGAIDAKSK